jgi:hypothetical protein
MVGCERLLDVSEGDKVMMDAITPHVRNTPIQSQVGVLIPPQVYHIHARIGTTQASQCPQPTNPVFKEEKESLERIWKNIIRSRIIDGATTRIVFVPEYGFVIQNLLAAAQYLLSLRPFPYHPIGSAKTHSQVADEEGQRLQVLFNDFAATLNDA